MNKTMLALGIVLLMVCSGATASTELWIDFGGGGGDPLQPDYVAWTGPYFGNPGINYDETRSFGVDLGVGGPGAPST